MTWFRTLSHLLSGGDAQRTGLGHGRLSELHGDELRQFAATPNRRFQFQKCSQLFIGAHNETLSVAAMCASNPDLIFDALLFGRVWY